MEAKRELLVGLVAELPLGGNSCYFCITNRDEAGVKCDTCDYAIHHKICHFPDGTWARIKSANFALQRALENYYTGETYTDEAKLARHAEYLKLKAEFEGAETQ